jgi:peptide/nickel transport system permease protein
LRPIWRYVTRRGLFALVVFLLVVSLAFFIATLSGNYYYTAVADLKGRVSQAEFDAIARYYRVSVPIGQRYLMWIGDLFTGDFGVTTGGVQVSSILWSKALFTLELVLPATVLSVLGGLYIGTYSAAHFGRRVDSLITLLSSLAIALPLFWVGTLCLVVFAGDLKWLPAFGAASSLGTYWWGDPILDRIAHLILPVTLLTLGSMGVYVRLARGAALELFQEEHMEAYKSLGLKDSGIRRHVVRGVLSSIVPFVGASVGMLLASSPAVEVVFNWPGIGFQFVQSARVFDQSVVMATVVLMAAITLVANLSADLFLAYVDPRVKLA